MQFGRGCHNACDYCAVGTFSKRGYACRPVGEVVHEIRAQNRNLVFFVDDNITAVPDAAKELFRALIPLNIKWVSQGTTGMTEDSELMQLMKKSGCLGHVIGFETLDPDNLLLSGKPNKINPTAAYEDTIRTLKTFGLQTWAAFTLGYDFDTRESLHELLRFALKHKFTFAAFNVLTPYPGTPFHERLKAEKRLLYDGKWWLHPDYRFNHAPFVPARMSADELTHTAFELRRRWNNPLAIVRRSLDIRTNLRSLGAMILFWTYNRLFRSETLKKQGMSFGYEPELTSGQIKHLPKEGI